MTAEDRLLIHAFNLGLLSIEYVPELKGARNREGFAETIPAQMVLRANIGGATVRLLSAPIDTSVPMRKVVPA